MNEQQNIATVQQAYAAFQRGDIEGVIGLLSDEVEWEPIKGLDRAVTPMAGRWNGVAEVRTFFQTLDQNLEFTVFEPKEYVAQGDAVVALGHSEANVRGTGGTFPADWAMAFTLRNGRIVRFREFTDTAAIGAAHQPSPRLSAGTVAG